MKRKTSSIGRPKVDIDQQLAKRIKDLRGTMSRQKFIDTLNIKQVKNDELMTPNQYRQFEEGIRSFPESVIEAILKYFEMDIFELKGIEPFDSDTISKKNQLYAELMGDYDIWSLLTYAKRCGYEITEISDDINEIKLTKDRNTYIYTYNQLQALNGNIERLFIEYSSNAENINKNNKEDKTMRTEFQYQSLLCKISEVYGNVEAFSKDLGMSLKSLDKRLFNVIQWKTPEIAKACELLHIDLADAGYYFFTVKEV